jgi:hypothetical protein
MRFRLEKNVEGGTTLKRIETFRSFKKAETWAEMYNYRITSAFDLEDDLGVCVTVEKL